MIHMINCIIFCQCVDASIHCGQIDMGFARGHVRISAASTGTLCHFDDYVPKQGGEVVNRSIGQTSGRQVGRHTPTTDH